jgi:osmotically-inducible protein OsmY
MKWPLLLLSVIALVLSPGLTLSQSKTTTDSAGGGHFMKDSWITTKTKTKLIADGRVKARHITVDTTDGVVTLLGKVDSEKERAAAEAITRKVKGVKGVKNALQVVPDAARKVVDAKDDEIEKAVMERLKKDQPLKDADIKVRSDAGVVTLMGKVPDARVKNRAGEMTRQIPGVKMVRNELH